MKKIFFSINFIAAIGLFVAICSIIYPRSTSALTGSDFNAGRIIDDATFYSKNSLSQSQIQNFLNSKVPTCDTYGTKQHYSGVTRAVYAATKGVSTPFICLKDYSQYVPPTLNSVNDLCDGSIAGGTKSAAQIIYDVSQACGVSSKVLLVLLQKEQSLVTDDWPWPIQYRSATGYGCPDTAPCDSEFFGFFNQVYQSAKGYKRYRANPANFNNRAGRYNNILYNPNLNCGNSSIYIENQATAGLYNYTPYQPNQAALANLYGEGDACSSYGNRNFWRIFSDWFGSTRANPLECDSRVPNVVCMWSIIKPDGSQFLTSSKSERDYTINTLGWVYEGIAFYSSQVNKQGSIPLYRLQNAGKHYFTVDKAERDIKISTQGWSDEGIASYVYPTTVSGSMSHRVYRVYDNFNKRYYWTSDENQKQFMLNSGYSMDSVSFNSFSGLADLPVIGASRNNVYRLQNNIGYFYTSSLYELEKVIEANYSYEGVLTSSNLSGQGSPVYRLRNSRGYFYTTNIVERDNAVNIYGMTNEGVGFFLDTESDQLYRLANTFSGRYLYTNNVNEVMLVANTGEWRYEGVVFDKNSAILPVYRFINKFTYRHFYTISLEEATRITNRGWQYETIAFSANPNSGQPVFRLRLYDKYLFTTDPSERDKAINSYGYTNEGVAYYASTSITTYAVYRLQSSNDSYFYTASNSEKDSAVSRYGFRFEGIGFYAP